MTLLGSENHLEAVNQVECQSSLWPFCQSMKCCSKRKMMLCIVLVSCNVPQEHCLQPESWGNIVMSIMVLGGTGGLKRCQEMLQTLRCLATLALVLQSRNTRCMRDLSTENSNLVLRFCLNSVYITNIHLDLGLCHLLQRQELNFWPKKYSLLFQFCFLINAWQIQNGIFWKSFRSQ